MQIAFVPAKVYAIGQPTPGYALCSYFSCLLPSDWPLAWSQLPVIAEAGCTPPVDIHSALTVRSPPVFETVVSHLAAQAVNEGRTALSCWPSANFTPEAAAQKVLGYADAEGLSESRLQRLRGIALIPVDNATRLAALSNMFLRMPVDATPLFDEVPAEFVPRSAMLKSLGVRDTPFPTDLITALQRLAGHLLTTVELACVTRVLSYLAQEVSGPEVRAAASMGHLLLPDASRRLTPAGGCAYIDRTSTALAARLGPNTVRPVHPSLSVGVCKALGVPSVGDVIKERLEPGHVVMEVDSIQGITPAAVATRLEDPVFVDAVVQLQLQQQAGICSLEEVAGIMRSVGEQLEFVEECRTMLAIKGVDGGIGNSEETVLADSLVDVPFFADCETNRILIAAKAGVSPANAIAAALSRLLASPIVLPLASLIEAPADQLGALAAVVTGKTARPLSEEAVENPQTYLLEASAGNLGSELVPSDAAAVGLSPLRPFAAGELVAYRSPGGALRYGRVPAASRPPAGSMAGAYRVTVEIKAGYFRDLMSTEVLYFDAGVAQNGSVLTAQDGAQYQHQQSVGLSQGQSRPPPSTVSSKDLMSAAQSLLASAGISLDADNSQLMEQIVGLRQELHRVKDYAATMTEETAAAADEAEQLRASWQCRICLSKEVNCVLPGCGHLLCSECAGLMPSRACPFCRKSSGNVVRLFK